MRIGLVSYQIHAMFSQEMTTDRDRSWINQGSRSFIDLFLGITGVDSVECVHKLISIIVEPAAFHSSETINRVIFIVHDVSISILLELDVPFFDNLAFILDIEGQFIIYFLERHLFFEGDNSSRKRWIDWSQPSSQKCLKLA